VTSFLMESILNRALAPTRLILLATLLLALAACEDSEDRAARHLQNAEALMAEGDPRAAALEFRNVLEYDPTNRAALSQLAEIQISAGAEDAAFGTYQRLVDDHPDATEGWLTLAEIAIRGNRWDQAATFAERAETLAPDSERTTLIRAALDFRDAAAAEDAGAAAAAAAVAQRHAESEPDNLIARQVLIAHAGIFLEPEDALAEVETALVALPDVYALHQIKVQLLADLGRTEAVGPALEAITRRFPDRAEPRQALVTWYIQQDDPASVENFLRDRAAADDATLTDRLNLVNFLRQTGGVEPALAEIDAQVRDVPPDSTREIAILRGLSATLEFERGQTDTAINEITTVLEELEPGADSNNLRVALARMLTATGRDAEAMAEIDAVLAQDSGHVEAIKIRARRLIDGDQTDDAVRLLRQAQATAPRDSEVVELMGDAHARAGNWELAGERYATAVDLAGNAAREALVYAGFLVSQGRPGPAETVLVDALREAPGNPSLLEALTELHIREGRLEQARRGIAQLRALDTERARRSAEALEADVLLLENRTGEMQALVEQMAAEGRGDAGTIAALIQAQITEGNVEEATALLEGQLETYPEDPLLRFLRAGLHLFEGDTETAETMYREILAGYPRAEPPLRVLYGLLMQQGRTDEAQALLEETRAAAPEAVLPRLLLAERAERAGDMAEAITLYEDIYADDTSNLVVANNLANLLVTREDDAEALDRAFEITRRLRGTQEPAFQDTYGWIAYLREDYDTALEYLSAAAEALPDEPTVQFHLGMTFLALERRADARGALERAVELAGDRPLPEAARAREALDGL